MKLKSVDDRTGYKEGMIVELSLDELNSVPFNVFMVMMPEDSSGILESAVLQEKEKLKSLLLDNGLSSMRVARLVGLAGCIAGLKDVKSSDVDAHTWKVIESLNVEKVVVGDLDGDGVFDEDDLKLAGRVLAKGRKLKKKR